MNENRDFANDDTHKNLKSPVSNRNMAFGFTNDKLNICKTDIGLVDKE